MRNTIEKADGKPLQNDLEKRFRNSGTAAGLMPKPYETEARKVPDVT